MKDLLYWIYDNLVPPLIRACVIACLLAWLSFVPYFFMKEHSLITWLVPTVWGVSFGVVLRTLVKLLEDLYGRPKI
jgi:hypothetical protein|nr:MAG TPA: Telomerase ribonucleoprotein complex - RNA binding domain [Caudoviricetes sp.]